MSGSAADQAQGLLDAIARHDVALRRYEKGVLRALMDELRQAEGEVAANLAAQLTKLGPADLAGVPARNWTTERLKALLDEIRNTVQIVRDILDRGFVDQLPDFAAYEATWMGRTVEQTTGITFDFAGLTPSMMNAVVTSRPFMGRHIRDEIQEMAAGQARILQRGIRQGILQGDSIGGIARRVAREGFDRLRRDTVRLVRTSVNHIANAAADEVWGQNQDLISGVKWVATLDGRTSAVCRARDGKIYPVGKGPRPPAHPNCRSRTMPVLKSWGELGVEEFAGLSDDPGLRPAVVDTRPVGQIPKAERRTKVFQVSAAETYGEWMRRQPRDFVDDVMGKSRAALYLRGGVRMDQFVDYSGREYTLDQLRRRHPAAFTAAGL